MTTREAIEVVVRELKEELVICTTGYTCRDVQAVSDRRENFYMIGSMGLAASLGLGVALSRPQARVVIFDGDGSVLMGLGSLPMVGTCGPRNFVHLVFDNERYVSTGGQPTYSRTVWLDRLAGDCGYRAVRRAESPQELRACWKQLETQEGPIFLLVKCAPDAGAPKERIRLQPEEITQRFMETVHASS